MYKRIIMVALAVASAVFGAIAISQAASTPHARPSHRRTNKDATVWLRHFAVLRSASAASATPLPAGTVKHLNEPGSMIAEYQAEPEQAHYLEVGGMQVWVIPGRKGLCLTTIEPGPKPTGPGLISTGCGWTSQVLASGVVQASWGGPGPSIVYGLVPDGDSVTITKKDGSHSNIPVSRNFFKCSGASGQVVTIHSASGAVVGTQTIH